MGTVSVRGFVEAYGRLYSEELGVSVSGGDDEVFKWFLASLLFGAPITESSAAKTYACFRSRGVLTPRGILEAGWDGLVEILDEGGYTRYDFKTADKLLEVAGNLTRAYGGSLSRLCRLASDARDLEDRLKALGKGVGDVTVSIFLRELRGVWEKADPYPTSLELLGGARLGLWHERASGEEALRRMKAFWRKNRVRGKSIVHFETALLRLGRECRRGKCDVRLARRR